MTYFLPSYFQKRLLRFALSRLDFIETDTLDLDDLGVTLGQRSVIELKNVGIKVKRLIETLNLPATIEVTQASIDLLRLTVPADLHASGIEVEVEGIQVTVKVEVEGQAVKENEQKLSSKPVSGPREYAYDHRISTNRIHDPGGRKPQHNHGQSIELSQVLPSSNEMASSFLESESRTEREELQAVIDSQSQLFQESVMSTSLDPGTGLGMPGGLTLPGFVANFFRGVADRLSVAVRNVTIQIEMHLGLSDTKSTDPVNFMLRLSEVALKGLPAELDSDPMATQKKAVSARKIEIYVLADSDSYSQTSSRTSPISSRSQSKVYSSLFSDVESNDLYQSHPLDTDHAMAGTGKAMTSASQSRSKSSGSHSMRSPLSPTSGPPREADEDEIITVDTATPSPEYASATMSDNLFSPAEAESDVLLLHLATSEDASDSSNDARASHRFGHPVRGNDEELSESKLFTHKEAESMYLSAISNDAAKTSTREGIPGAWEWADAVEEQDTPIPTQSTGFKQDLPLPNEIKSHQISLDKSLSGEEEGSSTKKSKRDLLDPQGDVRGHAHERLSNTVQSRIFHLDILQVVMPLRQTDTESGPQRSPKDDYQALSTALSGRPTSPSKIANMDASKKLDRSFLDSESALTPRQGWPIQSIDRLTELQVGTVTLDLDLNIAKLLLKVGQRAKSLLPSDSNEMVTTKAAASQSSVTNSSATISTGKIIFNFHEFLIKDSYEEARDILSESVPQNPPFIQLSMSSIACNISSLPASLQRLSISKIELQHQGKVFLSFLDKVHVRDSIASSSMLRPYDLLVNQSDVRFDVQLKPVHVVLDLASIDDILTRSGGLSSLLDLGNPIASTSTVKGITGTVKHQSASKRTVRFDEPSPPVQAERNLPTPARKVDLRIAGSVIDLVGSLASIQVKTSAVKLALRQDNIRVVIDGAAIEGPVLLGSPSTADLYARLRGIQIHYSGSPEEQDLDRLLSLLTPSSDKYDDDDDIMVDTLLRQRRKGAVLRMSFADVQTGVRGLTWQTHLNKLSDELSRLSSVTKYLPEDDRPGILTFALVNKFETRLQFDHNFGQIVLKAQLVEGSHISIPSLAAAQVSSWTLARGSDDIIIGTVIPQDKTVLAPPMLMCRFIADEMEPTVRLKLSNTCVEYKVPLVLALADLLENMEESKETRATTPGLHQSSPVSSGSEISSMSRKIKISVAFRDSAIALHPINHPAKGLFLLSDAVITHSNQRSGSDTNLDIKKASLLIINDAAAVGQDFGNVDHKLYFDQNDHVQQLTKAGFVPVGSMSSASAAVKVREDKVTRQQHLDVEFRNNLLFLETCADSTQTLIQLMGGLAPPPVPSKVARYRTEVVPIEDMLASFTGNAFVTEVGPELGLQASQLSTVSENDEEAEDDGLGDYFYPEDAEDEDDDVQDEMTESYAESRLARSTAPGSVHIAPVDITAPKPDSMTQSIMAHSMLDFRTDHFETKSTVGGTAHRWDSTRNTYDLGSESTFQRSPLKIRIRDVHIIWNLFDGYDWQATRDTISQAVKEIEAKALARRPRSSSRLSPGAEDDDESVIGDFLFNSIYIGIPANKDPRDLASAINHEIDDLVSETGSHATGTTVTASPTRRQSGPRNRPHRLRLNRSKHHKITIELEGVSADVVAFPPGSGEVESSVDVRVRKLEVFDHLPTSTWKKFATYMQDAGEREVDTNMLHLELLTVKPIAELAASELVLKITVLPLRLHVDQDALDFFSRFFEFKDDKAPVVPSSAPPFLQRVEVNPIQVKLDFKPKRVDYGGLRSGRTTEFMNFFILDRADMVLRRVILYGVPGFDRLGIMLNNIWMPDVKRNQLPGVLAGLAPIRPLVDVGSGVRELVAVPIREYKKDGRLVRSIQKGALAFAKTTATELINLGAKLAIGTQQVLQTTEELLVADSPQDAGDQDDEAKKQISLYADQPLGIVQGLRGAYASLERDLLLAKDAIVAVPGEVMSSGSATGAAKAILRQSPTIILRPAIGASKAVGQTLLGAGNTLDRRNLRRVEEKYKRH